MYKIYINETPLLLVDVSDLTQLGLQPGEDILIARYNGKSKSLLNYIDMLEKTQRWKTIVLHAPRLEQLWEDFTSLYTRLPAGGGLVQQANGKFLLIFRRGYWDLPKGKVDPGETIAEAALREVQEETGLQDLTQGPLILETFHTYRQKEKRYLKHTYWYRMTTTDTDLIPQAEEDIERAEWVELPHGLDACRPIYRNVLEVIEKGLG
jgi:8-oxo-dGTP pyrophosphatase MutT (NUDIX family)